MSDLIVIKNRQAVTSSLQVAENFDRNHRDVLKSIESLKEGLAQKFADLFHQDSYVHEQNKQEYPMYYMNRDGFTLLAMGFNGKKALEFKVKYIEAFMLSKKNRSKSWFGETNSILRCPVPGCEHTGSIITKVHCRMAHNMERDEVKKKYGMPLKIDVRKKKEEEK